MTRQGTWNGVAGASTVFAVSGGFTADQLMFGLGILGSAVSLIIQIVLSNRDKIAESDRRLQEMKAKSERDQKWEKDLMELKLLIIKKEAGVTP